MKKLLSCFLVSVAFSSSAMADGTPDPCTSARKAIVDAISNAQECAAVIRLDYRSYAVKGYQLVCGALKPTDAKGAVAATHYSYGASSLRTPSDSSDEHVFLNPPMDLGSLSVVSSRTGALVFEGSMIWSGSGKIDFPEKWMTDGMVGCNNSEIPQPSIRVMSYEGDSLGKIMKAVWQTALPAAMAQTSDLQDALIFYYAPSEGFFSANLAEWIYVLNAKKK